jgi:hypothetical protein
MNRDVARKLSDTLIVVQSELNDLVRLLQDECDDGEFNHYRRQIGGVMAALYSDILSPLYKEHPELIPPEMK